MLLTPSTPAAPNCCCSKCPEPYWSNPPFLIFDIRALWRSVLSARVHECQKLKIVGQTSMALNPSNGSNLEQLVLKGLIILPSKWPEITFWLGLFYPFAGRIAQKVTDKLSSYFWKDLYTRNNRFNFGVISACTLKPCRLQVFHVHTRCCTVKMFSALIFLSSFQNCFILDLVKI